jgi:hypothetical protein
MAETHARRAAAEARMRPGPQRLRLGREEITRHLAAIGDVTSVLATAAATVTAEARPLSNMYVKRCPRGDLNSEFPEDISRHLTTARLGFSFTSRALGIALRPLATPRFTSGSITRNITSALQGGPPHALATQRRP